MQPINLASRDPRIEEELRRAFPEATELVEYLRTAIVDLGGTRSVATLFVRGLKAFVREDRLVSQESVQRLCVHRHPSAVSNLDHVLMERAGYLEACLLFGQWLDAHITTAGIEPRHGVAPERQIDFMRLFICAYAMLVGIVIDPCVES